MSGALTQFRCVTSTRRSAMRIMLLAHCAVLVSTMVTWAGDPPTASKPAALSDGERKALLAERDRLTNETTPLISKRNYGEFLSKANKILVIERRVFGDVSDDVADSLHSIGQCQLAREDFAPARQSFQEEISIRAKLHGDKHWSVVDARVALQGVEIESRLTAEQRQKLSQARSLNHEIHLLVKQQEFGKALELARKAVEICDKILGNRHLDTATTLNDLAGVYYLKGQDSLALPLYRRALAISRKLLGEQHPTVADVLNNLACCYDSMDQYAQSEPLYKEALALRIAAFGENDAKTATSMANLASNYEQLGQNSKAQGLYLRVLAIRKKVLGDQHPRYGRLPCKAGFDIHLRRPI